MKRRDRLDLGVQLLVSDAEPFRLRPLHDEHFLHEVVDDLLPETETIGHLG